MTPDNTTILRVLFIPHPTPILRCATPPRLTIADTIYEHHTIATHHYPAAAPQTMPQEVDRRIEHHHRPIQETQI
jgi:hypothetical protein